MNQRVAVRALVKKDGKFLLLRRANGRPSILGKYELPGGKVQYGEQPEDAIARFLREDMGSTIHVAQLTDVCTYIDHDDRDMQYVFIVYTVTLASTSVELSQNYSHYQWKKMSDIHQDTLTESAKLLLGMSQQIAPPLDEGESIQNAITDSDNTDHVIIYSDGGSRGNPGPSASGYVILDKNGEVIYEGGAYLGITTNNQAEYHGVRLGLEQALEMGAKSVDFRMDSLLVVNQLNGIYKIKNRELWPIHERIRELAQEFSRVSFSHVRREFNQLADGMVNKILDAQEGK